MSFVPFVLILRKGARRDLLYGLKRGRIFGRRGVIGGFFFSIMYSKLLDLECWQQSAFLPFL